MAALGFLVAPALFTLSCQRVPLLAPSGSTITLTATTTALSFSGTTQIVAQIIEPAGTPPHSGTHIIFTTTLGTIQPSETETNINGQAIVTFNAGGASGTATISAASGGANVGSSGALKILVGTAAVGKVIVTANPTLVPALGGSSTIAALVIDLNGNPLVSAPVTFSTNAGLLSATFATTDQAGAAQTVLTTNFLATVTASVGAQGGGTTTTTPPASGGGSGSGSTTPTSGQASGTVTVGVAGSPTLVITPPDTANAGIAAAFTFAVTVAGTNASPIRNVSVKWGDGKSEDLGPITTLKVTHVYQSPGSYTVVATVTDSFGNSVPVSTSITVNPKPQPAVTLAAPTTIPTAGTDTLLTGSVTPVANTLIQDVVIDFGDGTITDLGSASFTGTAAITFPLHHVYAVAGTYTAVFTAQDSNGAIGRGSTTVFVQAAQPLGVTLNASANVGSTTTIETFTATPSGLGNSVVISFFWEFGNGDSPQTTTTNQITHSYAHPPPPAPTFIARVTITTSAATNNTATNTVVITP